MSSATVRAVGGDLVVAAGEGAERGGDANDAVLMAVSPVACSRRHRRRRSIWSRRGSVMAGGAAERAPRARGDAHATAARRGARRR